MEVKADTVLLLLESEIKRIVAFIAACSLLATDYNYRSLEQFSNAIYVTVFGFNNKFNEILLNQAKF